MEISFTLQVDLKPLREATIPVPTPKIVEKRKAEEADVSKDLKKVSCFSIDSNELLIFFYCFHRLF